MVEYVKRHNDTCEYKNKMQDCHKAFHFIDLPLLQTQYKYPGIGTEKMDLVHAINAAIAKLKHPNDPLPEPFKFTEKEALRLLVHYIGDLHQPLHVGSVYLEDSGKRVTPLTKEREKATSTHGGNSLVGTGGNLHHQWDESSYDLDANSIKDWIPDARKWMVQTGQPETWVLNWAKESLFASRTAYTGMTFSKRNDAGEWPMTFSNRKGYLATKIDLQEKQMTKAGARLASILLSIWPD